MHSPPIRRLLPDQPFPPYSFVPGRFPHPTSDPAGHSFGIEPQTPAAIEPERWDQCKPYLYGIDLFNAQYYWESHVEFESLWLACGRHGVTADFLKGLIKLAAAGVKHLEGKPHGVTSHACRATKLWEDVAQNLRGEQEFFLGFRLKALIEMAETIGGSGWPETPPCIFPSENPEATG